MPKFNRILVWTIKTIVSGEHADPELRNPKICFFHVNFRVNWNALYDKDHYERQDEIYKTIRPTLLSNTLVVPTQKIREHVENLSAKDYFGIRQQVEAFHRTNKKFSRTKFFLFYLIQMNYSFRSTIIINTC